MTEEDFQKRDVPANRERRRSRPAGASSAAAGEETGAPAGDAPVQTCRSETA